MMRIRVIMTMASLTRNPHSCRNADSAGIGVDACGYSGTQAPQNSIRQQRALLPLTLGSRFGTGVLILRA
jgi:hypothetical protein